MEICHLLNPALYLNAGLYLFHPSLIFSFCLDRPPPSSFFFLSFYSYVYVSIKTLLWCQNGSPEKRKGEGHGKQEACAESLYETLVYQVIIKKLQLNREVTRVIFVLITTFCFVCCNFYIQTSLMTETTTNDLIYLFNTRKSKNKQPQLICKT